MVAQHDPKLKKKLRIAEGHAKNNGPGSRHIEQRYALQIMNDQVNTSSLQQTSRQ